MEGNQVKMRDALEAFVESVEWLCEGDESGRLKQQFGVLLSAARAALSAPARNCDVGTAEEQCERFDAYCGRRHCYKCHLLQASRCDLAWAQMPYKAKRKGDGDGR